MQKHSSTNFPSFQPLDLLTLFWARAGHLRNLGLLAPPMAVVGGRWAPDWSLMESETWAPDRLSTESEMWEHWATFVSAALSVRERTGWVEARDLEGWEGVVFPGSKHGLVIQVHSPCHWLVGRAVREEGQLW